MLNENQVCYFTAEEARLKLKEDEKKEKENKVVHIINEIKREIRKKHTYILILNENTVPDNVRECSSSPDEYKKEMKVRLDILHEFGYKIEIVPWNEISQTLEGRGRLWDKYEKRFPHLSSSIHFLELWKISW